MCRIDIQNTEPSGRAVTIGAVPWAVRFYPRAFWKQRGAREFGFSLGTCEAAVHEREIFTLQG